MTIHGDVAVAPMGTPEGLFAAPRLLVVEPDEANARRLVDLARAAFPDWGEDVVVVSHLTDARGVLVLGQVDCVLLAAPAAHDEVLVGVSLLTASAPGIPVVVVARQPSSALLSAALRDGAQDVLGLDGLSPDLFRHAVLGAIARTLAMEVGGRGRPPTALAGQAEIFLLLDGDGRITFISDCTRELLGVTESPLGVSGFDKVHPADRPAAAETLAAALASPGVRHHLRLRARPGPGPWLELDITVTNLLDYPLVGALVVVGEDVTERTRIAIAGHLEAQLLDRLPAAVVVTDNAGVVVYWNRKATTIYGFEADEALGREISDLGIVNDRLAASPRAEARSTGRWEGEYVARRKDGSTVPVLVTLESVEAPEIGFRGMVGASLDNSERLALSESLAHQALHDPLTGLPNRALFLDRIDHALARLGRSPGTIAVLFVDLDRFKIINDTCGHDAGDEVLRDVAALFAGILRPEDTVARMGGDEFAVCCENVAGPEHALALAERLTAAVSQPFVVGDREFFVSPSIGVVLGHGAPGETAHTLLRDADAAMYHAKDLGRGRIELFDHGMRLDVVRRAEVASELRHAIQRDELRLLYQPVVALEDGRLVGFEALLRWQHPVRGLLGPGEFIDIAEDTNVIIPIGAWVIGEASRQLAAWRDELPEHPITMSLNLSAKQVGDRNLVRTVRAAIEEHQVQPSALCLEITESVLMEDAEASVATLRELKSLGVDLAIDDFGTGYSSLAYLKRFPVDFLKIDRSFVHGVARETEDAVIVKAVIELGKALGLSVVAEGVETDAQLAELRRLGCELAQGYRWSMPCPPADAVRLAATWIEDGDISPVAAAMASADESAILSTAEILAVLTHELATPLTVVKGQCERLVDLVGDVHAVADVVAAVVRNADRIENLVATLADAQQLDSGTLVVRATTFDLVELVRDIAPGALPEDRAIEIVADGVVQVEADGRRIEQILVNLLTNAHKFSPPEAPIRVTIESRGDEVAVVVADEGSGVPPERVGDIFRKFARLERSKKGVGLGLFLSRRMARAHGGDVHYFRRDPVGSEFALVLPRHSVNGPGTMAG